MRYKVGDKVKIRTFDDMEREYGLEYLNSREYHKPFYLWMEKLLKEHLPKRIVTIRKLNKDYYNVEETFWYWQDYMIESLYVEPVLIHSRFEILDL